LRAHSAINGEFARPALRRSVIETRRFPARKGGVIQAKVGEMVKFGDFNGLHRVVATRAEYRLNSLWRNIIHQNFIGIQRYEFLNSGGIWEIFVDWDG
jgi:hypothetical protein